MRTLLLLILLTMLFGWLGWLLGAALIWWMVVAHPWLTLLVLVLMLHRPIQRLLEALGAGPPYPSD